MRKLVPALFFVLSACSIKQEQGETILVEGVEIPIKACVEGNSNVFGASIEPVEFCRCLIPKLYMDLKNDPKKLTDLKDCIFRSKLSQCSGQTEPPLKQPFLRVYFRGCF
jgi:hypothetical protein